MSSSFHVSLRCNFRCDRHSDTILLESPGLLSRRALYFQEGYFLPASSGFSTIPEVPGQPLHMSGGVTSRGMRHSASAMELPRSGGAMGGALHEAYPMYGPGAAMAPLSHLPHFGSPRAQQVNLRCLLMSLSWELWYGTWKLFGCRAACDLLNISFGAPQKPLSRLMALGCHGEDLLCCRACTRISRGG